MSVTDRDLARAESFGRLAAKGGKSVRSCPYEANGSADERVLAARFVRAYLAAGGTVAVDFDGGGDDEDQAVAPDANAGRGSTESNAGGHAPSRSHAYGHLYPHLNRH